MLKQRVITALVLATVVLIALFTPNPVFWRGFISLIVLAGFYEWLRFCDIKAAPEKAFSYGIFGVALYVFQNGYFTLEMVLPMACFLWLVLLVFTMTEMLDFLHHKWLKLAIGVLILAAGAWVIIEFKYLQNGPAWVVCFICTVAAADIGAYFVGKRFGKTKLAPNISPGKTIEGFLGGLALVAAIAAPLAFFNFPSKTALILLITVLLTAFTSVGGDLFESKLKRHVGLKDSSNLLPGHGGILDRIDGILPGAFFFSLGLLMLGYLE